MLSKAEKKTLIKRFYTGESAKDIAHENNIPLSTLYYWINKNKPLRANRYSRFTQAEYHELKNEADKLSIEIEILQKALDYLNISRRSRLQFLHSRVRRAIRRLCRSFSNNAPAC